jgi:hypothetical protein
VAEHPNAAPIEAASCDGRLVVLYDDSMAMIVVGAGIQRCAWR